MILRFHFVPVLSLFLLHYFGVKLFLESVEDYGAVGVVLPLQLRDSVG